MKKTRLATTYEFDFELIGIVSMVKEYKLAWSLNQLKIFHLVKAEDIKIEFTGSQQILISNLVYEDEYALVHLLRNKLLSTQNGANQYLVPDLARFDYLLKVKNAVEGHWAQRIYEQMREAKIADYVMKIELDKIKQKENLLF